MLDNGKVAGYTYVKAISCTNAYVTFMKRLKNGHFIFEPFKGQKLHVPKNKIFEIEINSQ